MLSTGLLITAFSVVLVLLAVRASATVARARRRGGQAGTLRPGAHGRTHGDGRTDGLSYLPESDPSQAQWADTGQSHDGHHGHHSHHSGHSGWDGGGHHGSHGHHSGHDSGSSWSGSSDFGGGHHHG